MNSKTFWGNFGIFAAICFVFTSAYWLHPDPRGLGTHEHLFLPPCWFHWWTGIPCPACGLTTSFAYLAKGEFLKGFQTHPMGPVLFLIGLMALAYALVSLFRRRPSWEILESTASFWVTLALLSGLIFSWAYKISTQERTWIAIRSIL